MNEDIIGIFRKALQGKIDERKKLEPRINKKEKVVREILEAVYGKENVTLENQWTYDKNYKTYINRKTSIRQYKNREEIIKFVCDGAKLECPNLKRKLKLRVFHKKILLQDKDRIATEKDCQKENFELFKGFEDNKCAITGEKCLDCINAYWKTDTLAPFVQADNEKAVLKTSILKCRVDLSVEIKVKDAGQDFSQFGIKNFILLYWGSKDIMKGIKSEGKFVKEIFYNPASAIENDTEGGKQIFQGLDYFSRAMYNSPFGYEYKKSHDNFFSPISKFIWGDGYKNEKNEPKPETKILDAKDVSTSENPENAGKQIFKDTMKDVKNKGEKYLKNYKKNEKNKILDSYIPSQEWSDKTIEFLEKPYIRITNNVKIPVK
ncbi:PAAR-like protein [Leptotrichia wadei]|jgi:hypothetical protein|uniref:PAAR-like protein n=2 Tax=Leptotrichia TaxID=32067 RepID=UPI0028F07C59|nr:PAAR-like protein [uncultured Leptotrichia sp.]